MLDTISNSVVQPRLEAEREKHTALRRGIREALPQAQRLQSLGFAYFHSHTLHDVFIFFS